jgi:hypothetical protein
MATGRYVLADGTPVPRCTTIIDRYKDGKALIVWANREGLAGRDSRQTVGRAATAGSIAHDLIERSIKGLDKIDYLTSYEFRGATPELIALAEKGFEGYLRWASSSGIDVLESEIRLVSEMHRFGGTVDALGVKGYAPILLDWKTSNGVYEDYLLQVAAYAELCREVRGLVVEEAHLLRLGKDDGSFHHHSWPMSSDTMKMALEAFLMRRKLYDLDSFLKKRI